VFGGGVLLSSVLSRRLNLCVRSAIGSLSLKGRQVELEVVITMGNEFQMSTSSKSCVFHSEYGRYSGVANIFLQFLGGEERNDIVMEQQKKQPLTKKQTFTVFCGSREY